MRLCRFLLNGADENTARIGILREDEVREIPRNLASSLSELLNGSDHADLLARAAEDESLPAYGLDSVRLLAPVDQQEVWAAGVTYARSKQARMEESDFSASAYDLVYEAERPELFFKSLAAKVGGPNDPIGVRADSRWTVPEPELTLVMNGQGKVVGYTIGNDVSARDIEGENLLYLPQAKVYRHSCALGPWVVVGTPESEARQWEIAMKIVREDAEVFHDSTTLDRIRRSFDELASFLFRSQDLPHGACLLTGTGIVPPDDFTLAEGDQVTISISGIGALTNTAVAV